MFPPGHVGIALALYAPVGLLLLFLGRARLALVGTAVVAGVTLLPDVDTWLPWFVHRGRTHSVLFALATGVSLGAIAAALGGFLYRKRNTVAGYGAFGFCVGTLAVLAHLLGDVVTPMGVRPFYPLSGASYTFGLVLASDAAANTRLFALGCLATVAQFSLGVGLAPGTRGREMVRGAVTVVASTLERGPGRPGEELPDSGEAAGTGASRPRLTSEPDD